MQKLLYFHEKWCPNCEKMEPIVEQIRHQIPNEKINLEYEPTRAKEFNVTSIPTIILIEDGKEIKRLVGSRTQSQLINWLNG